MSSSGGGSVPPPTPSSSPGASSTPPSSSSSSLPSSSSPPSTVPPSSAPPPSSSTSVSTPPPSSSPEPPSSTTPSSTPPPPPTSTPVSSSTPELPPSSTPQPSPTSQAGPTPTTTQQQGSSSPSLPGNASSQRPSSSTPINLSSTSTSVYTSVLVSTGANGQIVTTTIQSTVLITPSPSPNSGGGSSSNTGAIVGGIAGGIAGLVAILLVGLFCWRRNRRRRDDFDGNFDPDRVVRHGGHTDLAGAEVTPYSYEPGVVGAASVGHSGPSTGGPTSSSGDGSMRQYRDSQALLAGAGTATSGSHYAPTSSDSASAYPSSIAHSSQHGGGMPVPQPYHPMSTKEREALRQRGQGGLGLASLEEGEVIQHMDGGQIPDPSVPASRPHEVPPSYDSIPGNDPR